MANYLRTNRSMIRPAVLLAVLPVFVGCHTWHQSQKSDYRTVVEAPNRDEAGAVKLNQQAAKALEKGHVAKAEQHLQEALIADVSYGPAHNNLGKIYLSQEKHYLAAWEFEFARRTMPEVPEPLNNLGLVYEAVGRMEEALVYYESAYTLRPTSGEFIGNLARVRLRMDEQDPLVPQLLEELIFYDTRPEWVRWARDYLGRHPAQSDAVASETVDERPLSPEPNEESLPLPSAEEAGGDESGLSIE